MFHQNKKKNRGVSLLSLYYYFLLLSALIYMVSYPQCLLNKYQEELAIKKLLTSMKKTHFSV